MIFIGMPGCDQGSTSLAWMMPPLPQLVSMAASVWRSIRTTSWPDFLRYHAVAVPTTPAPRTTVVMPVSPSVYCSIFWREPATLPALEIAVLLALILGGRRLVLAVAGFRSRPHGFALAVDAAGDVTGDLTQDLLGEPLRLAVKLADQAQMP